MALKMFRYLWNWGFGPLHFDKPDPPDPPDYAAAAAQQGQANLDAARATAMLSNPSFSNPLGSRSVEFGYGGNPDAVFVNDTLTPEGQLLFDKNYDMSRVLANTGIRGLKDVRGAMRDPFDVSGFQNIRGVDTGNLSDVSRLNRGELMDYAVTPDVAGLESVTGALMSRMQPQLDRQRQAKENELLIQGHNRGGEAWDATQSDLGQRENDALMSAILAGGQEQSRLFGLSAAGRAQGLGEQQAQFDTDSRLRGMGLNEMQAQQESDAALRAQQTQEGQFLRQLPLSELNALRTGSQPTMPQFQAYQGADVMPAPTFAATQAGYQGALNSYNAQAGQQGNFMNGLFGLGGSVLSGAGAAGGFGNLFSMGS